MLKIRRAIGRRGRSVISARDGNIKKAEYPELKKGEGIVSVVIAKKKDDLDSEGDVLTISSEKSCEALLLDSASSFYATPKKKWFSSYIEKDGGLAHLGDD